MEDVSDFVVVAVFECDGLADVVIEELGEPVIVPVEVRVGQLVEVGVVVAVAVLVAVRDSVGVFVEVIEADGVMDGLRSI